MRTIVFTFPKADCIDIELFHTCIAITVNISDINCTFQYDFCGWEHSTNADFNWTRNAGKTRSSSTGPTSDHTLATKKGKHVNLFFHLRL